MLAAIIGGGILGYYWTMKEEIKVPEAKVLEGVEPEEKITEVPYAFPDDFILSKDELPENFTLIQISEEEKKLGIESNPGFWDNPEMYKELYKDVDSAKIKHLYVSVYSALGREFGIFLVQYKTTKDLDSEIPKIIKEKQSGFKFLRVNEILVFIWTDGNNYDDIENVAKLLENKLPLKRI